MAIALADAADGIVRVGRRFDARGWVLGTSGNFSAALGRAPLQLAITRSGTHKGELTADDILELDETGTSIGERAGTPSAEARLHLEIYSARPAGAVLHTHSIWSTILSDRVSDGVAIEGYEMLKGLAGVTSHEHREWLPVLENDQDMTRLGAKVAELLKRQPGCHGFLLRRHGLYTWGATLAEAVRHVEILEFLLETVGRKEAAPWPSS